MMTQFTGKNSYLMGSSRQNRVRTSFEHARENILGIPYPRQQIPDQVTTGSQSTRIVTSPKPSHQAFLNWTAFNRSFAPNIPEIVRRTCPLLECEICFDSWENMLNHVKECPRLSKGMYRCFETGKEERIGRCESPRCLDLQRCKDRIANSIKRHLSPRGYGPRRQDSIPLEIQSVSPEADLTVHGMWETGTAELPCPLADCPPAYSLSYTGSAQKTPTELSSGDYSSFPCKFAELDAGEGASQYSDHLTQPETELAELGSNDDVMYTAQYFEPNTYGASELSTNNSFSYPSLPASAQLQQPHHSSSDCFNSQGRQSDWHQNLSMSNSPVSTGRCDSSHVAYENAQQVDCFASDMNGTSPPALQYGHPAQYYPSSTGSGVSTDDSWGGSAFSMISTPSRDTSMSSLEPHEVKVESLQMPVDYFLGESNRMCAEPDEMELNDGMEALHPQSTDFPERHINNSGSWDACSNSDDFFMDVDSGPHLYPSYVPPHEGMQHSHFQNSGGPASPPPLSYEQPPPWPFRPEIDYSRQIQSPVHKSSHPRHVSTRAADECRYCGASFIDKSNLKRHERRCKKNPTRHGKKYFCHYPSCGKGYARTDALLFHQKKKGHQQQIELDY